MHITDVLGWTGCTFLTVNIIPQIYKIRITKRVEDVSTTFIIINTVSYTHLTLPTNREV